MAQGIFVHRKLVKWREVRVDDTDGKLFSNNRDNIDGGYTADDFIEKISLGIPRDPDDFVREAIKAGHPGFHPSFLDYKSKSEIDNLLKQNLVADVSLILGRRAAWLKKWANRAKQLVGPENALHSTLHRSLKPHCAAVLEGKRLLLLGEMLRDILYPDVHLVENICEGLKITGWLRHSGCFEKLPQQPSLTVDGLVAMSGGLNHTVVSGASSSEKEDGKGGVGWNAIGAWAQMDMARRQRWLHGSVLDS